MNQSVVKKEEIALADSFHESEAKLQFFWQNMGQNYALFMWELWRVKSERLWQGGDFVNEEQWIDSVLKSYALAKDVHSARSTLYQIWGAIGIMCSEGMNDEQIRFVLALKNPAVLYGITNHWKLDGRHSRGEMPVIRQEVRKMIEDEGHRTVAETIMEVAALPASDAWKEVLEYADKTQEGDRKIFCLNMKPIGDTLLAVTLVEHGGNKQQRVWDIKIEMAERGSSEVYKRIPDNVINYLKRRLKPRR